MARRTNVVDRGVHTLNAGLADVADLEPRLAALMRRRNGAAAAAEVSLAALGGGSGKTRGAAVVTRGALRALADIGEAIAVAVRAIGAQELGGEACTGRAVASRRAKCRMSGVLEAVGS